VAKSNSNKARPSAATGSGNRRDRLASFEAARKKEQRRRSLLLLGSLVQGTTSYYLPALDSPVVDAGLLAIDCPPADQRGTPRSDARCDVGAVEPSNPLLFRDGFDEAGI